jgi:Ca-activated chloride channel family protein
MSRLGLVLTASLFGATVGATAVALEAQGVVFSSKVEAVRVDVLVTDRDKAVVGLKPADFELLDNGVPQQVDLVSFEQIPLNVVLALDMSESVSGDRLEQLRDASSGLLGALTRDDQAGLVTFTERVVLGSRLTKDLDNVRKAMESPLSDAGDTSIIDASFAAMMLGESDVGRGLVIVFSDGIDTASWLPDESVLNTAKRSDVVVYAVSVQSRLKPEFLRELTSATGGRLYEIEKTANLSQVFLNVLEEFRHRYLISYTPTGVDRGGWHKLDVSIKGRKAVVKARPGYLGAS